MRADAERAYRSVDFFKGATLALLLGILAWLLITTSPKLGAKRSTTGTILDPKPDKEPVAAFSINTTAAALPIGDIVLSGTIKPGSEIYVRLGRKRLAEVKSDSLGLWKARLNLPPGDHKLKVGSGTLPEIELPLTAYEKTRPTILRPSNGDRVAVVDIIGVWMPERKITLTNNGKTIGEVETGDDGLFRFETRLNKGTNVLAARPSTGGDFSTVVIYKEVASDVVPRILWLQPLGGQSAGPYLIRGIGNPGQRVIAMAGNKKIGTGVANKIGQWSIRYADQPSDGVYSFTPGLKR